MTFGTTLVTTYKHWICAEEIFDEHVTATCTHMLQARRDFYLNEPSVFFSVDNWKTVI